MLLRQVKPQPWQADELVSVKLVVHLHLVALVISMNVVLDVIELRSVVGEVYRQVIEVHQEMMVFRLVRRLFGLPEDKSCRSGKNATNKGQTGVRLQGKRGFVEMDLGTAVLDTGDMMGCVMLLLVRWRRGAGWGVAWGK